MAKYVIDIDENELEWIHKHFETLWELCFNNATPLEEFEWCNGCKEHDNENHCCHRYSNVIRNALNDNIYSVLEDIKGEICDYKYGNEEMNETDRNRAEAYNFALGKALEIIDKHMKGKE